MSEKIAVHLACNDDHGNFAGELYIVEFGDELLKLEGSPMPDEGLPFGWVANQLRFENAGQVRWFDFEGYGHWVGSMAWDAVQMTSSNAEDFARYLLERGFIPTEWVCQEPWESIVELSFKQPTGVEH